MAEKEILKLGALKPAPGSRPKRQRIGRGHGSGMVKTGGEGGKGQTVRSGGGKGPAFEGGQTPWARRLPHGRGYSQKARDTGHFGTRLAVVKLSRLSQWDASIEISPESLRERGVLKALRDGVKILGDRGLASPFRRVCVSATCSSQRARAKRWRSLGPTSPSVLTLSLALRAKDNGAITSV